MPANHPTWPWTIIGSDDPTVTPTPAPMGMLMLRRYGATAKLYQKTGPGNTQWQVIEGAASSYRTYIVAPDGSGDFTSVAAAVAAAIAQGPVPTNPWAVIVQPGEYIEPPFTLMPGIVLTSRTTGISDFDALITAQDPNQDLITMVGGSLGGICLRGVTAPNKALIRMSGAGTGGFLTAPVFTGPTSNCIIVENGAFGGGAQIISEVVDVDSAITGAIYTCKDVGSQLIVSSLFCFAPDGLIPFYAVNPIQTCFKIIDGGAMVVAGAVISVAPKDNTQINAYADTGGRIEFYSASFQRGYTGIYIGAGGVDSRVFIQGGAFNGHTTNFKIDSATGQIFCSTMIDDDTKKAIVPGGVLTGLFSNTTDAATQLAGNVDYTYTSERNVDLGDAFHTLTSSGVTDGGEVTDAGGLTVDVAAGEGWSQYPADGATGYSWDAVAGLALAANMTNYVYIDGTTMVPTAAVVPPPESAITLAIVVTDGAAVLYTHEGRNLVGHPYQRLFDYLIATRRITIKSGVISSNGVGPLQIDISGGIYYRAAVEVAFGGFVGGATFAYFYNNGATRIAAQVNLNNTQYDNAGVLTLMTGGWYRADTVYVTSDQQVSIVYGTEQFATQAQAEAAGVAAAPASIVESACRSALVVVQQGGAIVSIIDARPNPDTAVTAAAGTPVTVHGALLGLAADDHPQYLLANGGRAMTGDLNMGGQSITNVNLVDGVDVPAHAVRHQPGGADAIATAAAGTIAVGDAAAEGVAPSISRSDHTHALPAPPAPADVTKAAADPGVATTVARSDHKHDIATGVPSSVGTANAEGAAVSLARADHVHDHGAQPLGAGTQHAVATGAVAGFMAAADKAKLDGIEPGATATPLTAVAPVNVTKAVAAVGVSLFAARSDHKHDITTAAPSNVGQANAEGGSASLARADHVHKGALVQSAQATAPNTNTNSAAYVDLLNVSIPMNTGADFLLIDFTACCSANNATTRQISFQLLVDGVAQVACAVTAVSGFSSSAAMQWRVAVAAGAHVIKVQWKTTGGTAQIRPGSDESAVLRVAEVLY